MGKRVPATKQTENKGLIAVAQFANCLGWTWRPTPNDDYGLDGELEPVQEGQPTGKIIKVQIKSGKSYRKGETESAFHYVASVDDLRYWSSVNVPVLVVIHDPDGGRTYGVEIHRALAADPSIRRTRRIPFNKSADELTRSVEAPLLAAANDEESSGRVFRRQGGSYQETLYSNLLPVKAQPARIFGAPTTCRTAADIRAGLGDRRKTPAVCSDGMLWTFADLTDPGCSLRAICDNKSVSHWLLPDWSSGAERQRLLVQLMNTCLRKLLTARGLVFDRDKGRYYFPPESGNARRCTYQSLQKTTTRRVAYPHVDRATTAVDYWVHWSAKFRFIDFARHLYLMVEPSMIFTEDGVRLVGGDDMGRLSTTRSSHRFNRNVLGFLYFWRWLLRGDEADIAVFRAPPPQRLSFHGEYITGIGGFGIDGDNITVKDVQDDLDEIDLDIEDEEHHDLIEGDEHDDDRSALDDGGDEALP